MRVASAALLSGFRGRSQSRRVGQSTRRALWAYLFISPFYISFLVFGVFPIVFSFYLALTRWTPYQSTFIGAANFVNLLRDNLVHKALFNSLSMLVLIVATVLCLA